ncbi:MAG: RagB/SusD family nutrient uptake outer membrane protein [Cyclobacteriaceae bacterium]|nr:RagB/SusD family nutrient uptake outer membrane protein [Cyclobacteriaceae bacterium]
MRQFTIISKRILQVLVLVVLLPVSCDDFLDKPLQGKLTQENFPTSASDALLATNGVYNIMLKSSFHFGLFPIMDIMSDDARKGSNPDDAASTIGPFDKFTHIATEANLSRWWSTLYEGIRRANVVIEKVPVISMNATLRDRYIGEASFLRALFYFDLVRAWGDVPKVTTSTVPLGLPRANANEIYDLIVADLEKAISGLPEKSDYASADLGRATRGAAKSLLAKVYLFKGDFVNAEKYAMEVINSAQYDLMPDFADANSKAGEFGAESVFEIGAIGIEGTGGVQYGNVQGVRGTPNRGWGFNRPTLDLMDAFEPGDPREDKTIVFLGEVLDGITIAGDGPTLDETYDTNGDLIEIECYNQKVWTPGNNVPTQFDHNRRIIRYADVLLMAAEALNKNNKPAEARVQLNKVRARARHGNNAILLDITENNKDLLHEIILHERRVELAMEGHRFWDLVRTGKAAAVLGPLGFVAGKHELLPVPQNEMDLTQNTWTQNPGW